MSDNVLLPPPVRPGDTIGVAAPASPFDREAFDRGVAAIAARGFRVRVPESVFAARGFLAGPDRQRADAFNALTADPDVRAILCARGGYGSMRILPLVDFGPLRRHPKYVVGFSDITFLLNAIYERCGLAALHGPLVTTLEDSDNGAALFSALTGGPPPVIESGAEAPIRGGVGRGPVVGGNLTCFCHLLGTPWQVRLAGRILLLEDRGEEPYRVDRMLTHLKLAGGFERLAGVAIGGFDDRGELDAAMREVFEDAFRGLGFPVVAGFPVGHGPCNRTVPIGRQAVLDGHEMTLRFE